MRRRIAAWVLVAAPLLSGCDFSVSLSIVSGDFGFPGPVTAAVASDPATDGDVRSDGAVETAAVILAGVDPFAFPPAPEFRGFVSFPLGGIPVGAWIESATVSVTVDRVDVSGAAMVLAFDRVRYGSVLAPGAFDAPGTPVAGLPAGVSLVPSAAPRVVAFDVARELQADVNDPSSRFFQLRARGAGGLAYIVDGAGNRANGLPPDRALAPVLTVVYRP